MEKWMKDIYVMWNKAQKSKFTNQNNEDHKLIRWENLFKWNQNVGRLQRMIRKMAKKVDKQHS
ncbi:MAG: hypothetical protein ACXAC5_05215 [Promethearchaeota archaeon]|jgi:hypothetical protein